MEEAVAAGVEEGVAVEQVKVARATMKKNERPAGPPEPTII